MRTHSYVGALPCGCGVAMVVDDPQYPKDTAKDVADMIRRGLVVQRFTHDQAKDAFIAHCTQYPHEPWQIRIEAARSRPVTEDR